MLFPFASSFRAIAKSFLEANTMFVDSPSVAAVLDFVDPYQPRVDSRMTRTLSGTLPRDRLCGVVHYVDHHFAPDATLQAAVRSSPPSQVQDSPPKSSPLDLMSEIVGRQNNMSSKFSASDSPSRSARKSTRSGSAGTRAQDDVPALAATPKMVRSTSTDTVETEPAVTTPDGSGAPGVTPSTAKTGYFPILEDPKGKRRAVAPTAAAIGSLDPFVDPSLVDRTAPITVASASPKTAGPFTPPVNADVVASARIRSGLFPMSGVAPIEQAQAGRVAAVASVTNTELDSAKPAVAAVESRSRASRPPRQAQLKAKVTSKSAFDVKPQVKPGYKDTRGPRGTAGLKRTPENLVKDFGAAAPTSAVPVATNATPTALVATPTDSPSFSISSPIIPTTPVAAPAPLFFPTTAQCEAEMIRLAQAVAEEKASFKEAVATGGLRLTCQKMGYGLHGAGQWDADLEAGRKGKVLPKVVKREGNKKRSFMAEMLDKENEERERREREIEEKEKAGGKTQKKIQQKKGMQCVKVKFVKGAWVVGA